MNDTISRAMALEVIEVMMNLAGRQGGKVLCGKLYAQIKDLPATDAVPVVRCKDCKYYVLPQGFCYVVQGMPKEDFYCAAGKRRDTD